MRKFQVLEEHIATPAELAKAYMSDKSSKVSPSLLGSRSLVTRHDVTLKSKHMLPSESPSMNTATKSSSQLITTENGYYTPLSKGKSAVYSMARTSYSRMQKVGLIITFLSEVSFGFI